MPTRLTKTRKHRGNVSGMYNFTKVLTDERVLNVQGHMEI